MSASATSRPVRPSRIAARDRGMRPRTLNIAITRPRVHWAVILLLATWVMPFVIYLGGVRLSAYRFTLIILFVPCLVWLVQGRAGRVRLPDILVALFALWCVISLTAVNGLGTGVQTGGIQVLETITPYLIARCCIRTADDFRALGRLLTGIALVLLPFALYEAISGHNIYLEIASHIFPSIEIADKEPRWGLRRAQLFFEHPILMGVCLGSIVALTHMVVGRELSFGRRWMRSVMVGLTGALSLSSGPISGILVQIMLMGWNWVLHWFRARWMLLISLAGAFVLAVQLFAKRPLPNILFSFAFEQESAFFRIVIWDFGTQSVANHPLFGVGMGDWERPSWMPPSIDMFWLYNAIVYGIPGGALMLAFFLASVITVGRVKGLDQRHYDYRAAYLISMCSFFLTGWMVHFWNGTYVFFMFMVGAGIWLRDAPFSAPAVAVRVAPSTDGGQRLAAHGLLGQKPHPAQRQARGRRNR
ncbi:O-antigen ligase domain-containing protein [Devosia sp. 2618]|uniref:O-antigen ligase family protein n=1 Tax=Devosia sp. 2618 TaxID=3156454 RepID=UPI003390F343